MCAILCHRGLHINVNNNNNKSPSFNKIFRGALVVFFSSISDFQTVGGLREPLLHLHTYT